jgi:hypothetical protein
MAFLLTNPSIAFDVSAVDLNWYVRNLFDADLQDNVNAQILGRTYTDVYYVNGYTGREDLEVSFGWA